MTAAPGSSTSTNTHTHTRHSGDAICRRMFAVAEIDSTLAQTPRTAAARQIKYSARARACKHFNLYFPLTGKTDRRRPAAMWMRCDWI